MVELVSGPVAYLVDCATCGAVLRFGFDDVVPRSTRDYSGGTDTYYEIKCLGCGSLVETGHSAQRVDLGRRE